MYYLHERDVSVTDVRAVIKKNKVKKKKKIQVKIKPRLLYSGLDNASAVRSTASYRLL